MDIKPTRQVGVCVVATDETDSSTKALDTVNAILAKVPFNWTLKLAKRGPTAAGPGKNSGAGQQTPRLVVGY